MKKCIFLLSVLDKTDLQNLALEQSKSMSELIREAIGLLKLRYTPQETLNTFKSGIYKPKKAEVADCSA